MAKSTKRRGGSVSIIDWPLIWREYRRSRLTLPELAKVHNLNAVTLRSGLARYYGAAYHAVAKERFTMKLGERSTLRDRINWEKAWVDYKAGVSVIEIGRQYGCTGLPIRQGLIKRYGKAYRDLAASRKGMGRQSLVDWAAVWEDVRKGAFAAELAKKYGISLSTVYLGMRNHYGQTYHERVRSNMGRNHKSTPRGTMIGKLIEAGAPLQQLKDMLGYSHSGSLRRFPEYRDRLQDKRERFARYLELHHQGWTTTEIAEVTGRPRDGILSFLKERGLIPNVRRPIKTSAKKPAKLKDRR